MRAIKFMFCVAALLGAGCRDVGLPPPERPKTVPANAVWAGGPDGGNWFNCKKIAKKWHYECSVYADFDGQLVDGGEYVLKSVHWDEENKEAIVEEMDKLTINFNGFDGHAVMLTNTLVMTKIAK